MVKTVVEFALSCLPESGRLEVIITPTVRISREGHVYLSQVKGKGRDSMKLNLGWRTLLSILIEVWIIRVNGTASMLQLLNHLACLVVPPRLELNAEVIIRGQLKDDCLFLRLSLERLWLIYALLIEIVPASIKGLV
jgi:hypothetical protein